MQIGLKKKNIFIGCNNCFPNFSSFFCMFLGWQVAFSDRICWEKKMRCLVRVELQWRRSGQKGVNVLLGFGYRKYCQHWYKGVFKHHSHSLCFNPNLIFTAICFCLTDGIANNASLLQNSRKPTWKGILPVCPFSQGSPCDGSKQEAQGNGLFGAVVGSCAFCGITI